MTKLRIGVAPHRLWAAEEAELDEVVETAVLAEQLGFDHVIASSHILDTDLGPTPDPLTTLSVIAGATSRVGLVTSVLILPLYNPVVVAHQTATLDRLSRGRFTLGVGTGWDKAEFDAVGVPFPERGRRTDTALETVRGLWRKDTAGLKIGVAPQTLGGPRIWVGGTSDAALRRALRFGDAWHGSALNPETLAQTRNRVDRIADQYAIHRPDLKLTTGGFLVPPGFTAAGAVPGHLLGGPNPSAASVIDELSALEDGGLDSYSLWLPVPTPQLKDALSWVATEILSRSGR